jgi:hypothetical protein
MLAVAEKSTQDKMDAMTPDVKRRTLWIAGVVCLAGVLVLLLRWAFSRPHSHLEYMVAGTLATSILLAGAFVQIVQRGYLGRRQPGGIHAVSKGEGSADEAE